MGGRRAPCRAPRPMQLNKQYWAAYKAFFNRKNDFFKSRSIQREKYGERENQAGPHRPGRGSGAEQPRTSTMPPASVVIRVQKEWKDVGRVPDKLADKLWHRFRAACDSRV